MQMNRSLFVDTQSKTIESLNHACLLWCASGGGHDNLSAYIKYSTQLLLTVLDCSRLHKIIVHNPSGNRNYIT